MYFPQRNVLLRGSRNPEELLSGAGSGGVQYSTEKQLFCSAEQQICREPRGLLTSVAKEAEILAAEHKRSCPEKSTLKFCQI
jgi:hypothetical protein